MPKSTGKITTEEVQYVRKSNKLVTREEQSVIISHKYPHPPRLCSRPGTYEHLALSDSLARLRRGRRGPSRGAKLPLATPPQQIHFTPSM